MRILTKQKYTKIIKELRTAVGDGDVFSVLSTLSLFSLFLVNSYDGVCILSARKMDFVVKIKSRAPAFKNCNNLHVDNSVVCQKL